MKLKIIETRKFSKKVNGLIRKRQLLKEDFDCFKRCLVSMPESGIIISGTGGIRKIRLKASSRGKSGGFRVCYYYLVGREIYLILLYAKNEQANLTMEEKKELRVIVKVLKGIK